MSKLSRRAVAGGLLAVLAFAGAACGDDEEPTETGEAPTTTTTEATTTTAAPDEATTTTAAEGDAAGDVVTIIGTNDGTESYSFEDVPTEAIPAGTKLSLQNTGTEPHELVAIRIPDTETRSVEELVALTDEERAEVFGGEPQPATVIVSLTGTTDTPGVVEGDGTLTEPGRYAIICQLPTGVTDAEVANATGPLETDAPPHVAFGMYAEITVE